jgi:flavin reductase (DIM6/NTAB) family NADH-FMN oxidoreductase RutF
MTVDSEALRATMRLWSCGVTVVTSQYEQQHNGMTASSFTSISLDPPLVLVCLHKEAETSQIIQQSHVLGISILGADHANLSSQFAGYTELPPGADKFHDVPTFTARTGSPLLQPAIAWLDCEVYGIHDGATHHIVIGQVVATGRMDDPIYPLVYHNRAYRRFVDDQS